MRARNYFILTIPFLASCDYYYAAMDYKDNGVLQQVTLQDRLINENDTPIVVEIGTRCLLKKNNSWILLNYRSSPAVNGLSDPAPCLTRNEIEWSITVCDELTKKNIHDMSKFACKK